MRIFLPVLCAAALFAADKRRPQLPAPYHTPSATNAPKLIPQPAGAQLKVPSGFRVEPYATGFAKPRIMLELPGGAVLVSESVANGSIIALTEGGKQRKALLTGLARPFGMAFHDGYLYVTEDEAIKRYKLDPSTLKAGAGEKIIDYTGYTKGHWSRSLAIDPKAKKLYVSVGSGSNVDPGDPANRAAINVYNLDGTGHEIFATGLRNPVSIGLHPASKALWTTCQERDGLGDDLVPDFFTSVKKGAFYGWPYAYIGPNEEPRNKGQRGDLVAQTVVPDVVLGAHVAVMDFTFYSGKQFPARYRNGAFLAQRGSSNRSQRVGYNVLFVPFKGGKPAGKAEDFLSGWMLGPGQREVWGRPVGVTELTDGSLLVSEDGNNSIWRITYQQ